MTDATIIIPRTRGVSPRRSLPCIALGGAVQAAERLLWADDLARGLPHGDPAYHADLDASDLALERAIDAASRAGRDSRQRIYRRAARLMHRILTATSQDCVSRGMTSLERLYRDHHMIDSTVRTTLGRVLSVMDSLVIVWGQHADLDAMPEPADEPLEPDEVEALLEALEPA